MVEYDYHFRYRAKCPICGMQLETTSTRNDRKNDLIWGVYEQHRLENHIDEMNDLADKAFPMGKVDVARISDEDDIIRSRNDDVWTALYKETIDSKETMSAPKGSLIEEVIPTPSASVVIGGLALTAGLIAFLYFRKKKVA